MTHAPSSGGRWHVTAGLARCFQPMAPGICSTMLLCGVLPVLGCASPTNSGRAIVILGASSGFGKGVALKLADQKANLVLAARRTELLEDLASQCRQRGGQAIAVPTDASKPDEVQHLAEAGVSQFGRIDVWINMAGTGAIGRFEDIPLQDHLRLIDINLKGVINGSYHAMQQFDRQGYGTLVNMGSVTSRLALPYFTTYSASKQAVLGLGLALHQELRLTHRKNIHVSTIMPYAADTPYWEHSSNYTGHKAWVLDMYGPEIVVDAVVRATLHPHVEVPVGFKAASALASHQLTPRLTENLAGDWIHKSLIEQSPPAPTTQGSLFTPMPTGTGVSGGVREQIKEYERSR